MSTVNAIQMRNRNDAQIRNAYSDPLLPAVQPWTAGKGPFYDAPTVTGRPDFVIKRHRKDIESAPSRIAQALAEQAFTRVAVLRLQGKDNGEVALLRVKYDGNRCYALISVVVALAVRGAAGNYMRLKVRDNWNGLSEVSTAPSWQEFREPVSVESIESTILAQESETGYLVSAVRKLIG